jgi:hypothetical protein
MLLLRALRGIGHGALLLAVLGACSDDETSQPLPPAGPASVEITGIALGQGFVGEGGASSVLACDYTIGVNVQTANWTLLGPGRCSGALQCGQLRVSLLGGPGNGELLTLIAAGNGAALNVRSLTPPLQAGMYAVKVELVDDLGKVYNALNGGNGSAQQQFFMELPGECTSTPGSGGASGGSGGANDAGAGGETAGTAGTAGTGGGSAGTAGTGGGSAGTAGTSGGSAGTAGTVGTGGGSAGTAGVAGDAAGTAGGPQL